MPRLHPYVVVRGLCLARFFEHLDHGFVDVQERAVEQGVAHQVEQRLQHADGLAEVDLVAA